MTIFKDCNGEGNFVFQHKTKKVKGLFMVGVPKKEKGLQDFCGTTFCK